MSALLVLFFCSPLVPEEFCEAIQREEEATGGRKRCGVGGGGGGMNEDSEASKGETSNLGDAGMLGSLSGKQQNCTVSQPFLIKTNL